VNTTARVTRALVLAVALLLAACGGDEKPAANPSPFPGTWALDANATAARMKDLGLEPDVAAIEKSKMTIEIKPDGTYRATADGAEQATGTWKGAESELTLEVLTEGGKPVKDAPARAAVLHEGALVFESSATTQPLVMRRR
jgi:major membrane immunogen (membrane-anchored lipoprotein)